MNRWPEPSLVETEIFHKNLVNPLNIQGDGNVRLVCLAVNDVLSINTLVARRLALSADGLEKTSL